MIYGPKHLAAAFRTVRGNTIQTAEDIPEESYGFRASEDSRTVAEILQHIALAPWVWLDIHRDKHVSTMKDYDFQGTRQRLEAESGKYTTKQELITLLKSEGEKFASWLETLTPEFLAETVTNPMGEEPKSRMEGIMGCKEHEMHHRAQLMLIERMLGIVPHLTRRREEFFKQRAAQQSAG